MANLDSPIYQLTVADLQDVANDLLNRELTYKEIELLEDKIVDYIDWYSIIQNLIDLYIEEDDTNAPANI